MVFSNTVPSHLSTLSLQQALDLANLYLHNAYSIHDHKLALVLCHDAEVALSQAKKANKKYPAHPDDARYQAIREGVAMAYVDLGKYLDRRGYPTEAMALCRKAEKWGGKPDDPGRLALQSRPTSMVQPSNDSPPPVDSSPQDVGPAHASRVNNIRQQPQAAVIPHHIFADNVRPPAVVYKLPQPDERLSNTPQLVCCLSLLQVSHSPNVILDPAAHNWLQAVERDADEQERLHALSTQVVRAFMKDELKDAKAVAEVVCLAPALTKEAFHDLIREFHTRISQSAILNFQLLEGIAQLIQGADSGYLGSDDLVKILQLFSTRLIDTHQQSAQHMHQLTLAVSHVLDAMADTKVTGIDRVRLHEPLSAYLNRLKESKDPFLVYQAAYAYQALLCIPDNETTWQAAMRRTGRVVQGVAGLVTAAKGLDLEKFINGLADIQQGLGGVVNAVKTGYDGIALLAKNGQGFVDCLKEGLSFSRQRDWYSALRGTDILIRDGEFLAFKTLVCRAPCQRDPAFQWGVCQRLGEIAANPMWDPVTRKSAIEFLGEIYRDDETWGQHASVKQWILNILMELASGSGTSGSSGGIAKRM
ncbi:hypothetical protein BGX31_010315 [Mortierella sp. GBA43]|nr:hypothetical protein BGX31_010315 [Mortierella sp. GBA43]